MSSDNKPEVEPYGEDDMTLCVTWNPLMKHCVELLTRTLSSFNVLSPGESSLQCQVIHHKDILVSLF